MSLNVVRSMFLAAALSAAASLFNTVHGQDLVELPAADKSLELASSELYSVGSFDGEDWELFGNRVIVAFGPDERLFVLDAEGHRVLILDSAGELVSMFGREGSGPGELQSPTAIAVTGDSLVVIVDMAKRGLSVFGLDGTFVRFVGTDDQFASGVAGGGSGSVVTEYSMKMQTGQDGQVSVDNTPQLERQAVGGAAGVSAIYQQTVPEVAESGTREVSGGGMRMSFGGQREEFAPALNWAVLGPSRIAIADEAGYLIKILERGSGISRHLVRPIEPAAVSEIDQEEVKRRRRAALEGTGSGGSGGVTIMFQRGGGGGGSRRMSVPQEMIDQMVDQMTFADVRPVISGLTADRSGRMWVRRDGTEIGEPGPVDLVSAAGEYLGTLDAEVVVPDAFGPGGMAAFVEKDELDVVRVVVRRLSVPGS
ncbi:MAG: 6-bladed beta-propeller [Gemmatimonadota bacterium]